MLPTLLFMAACAPWFNNEPSAIILPNRAAVVENMAPVREYEELRRRFLARFDLLLKAGHLSTVEPEDRIAMQDAADVAFAAYYAGLVALANGDFELEFAQLRRAMEEMAKADAVLKRLLRRFEF